MILNKLWYDTMQLLVKDIDQHKNYINDNLLYKFINLTSLNLT